MLMPQWMWNIRKYLLRFRPFKRWFARRWLDALQSGNLRQNADIEHDLIRLGEPVVPILIANLTKESPIVRLAAFRALRVIDPDRARSRAADLLRDPYPEVVETARRFLESSGDLPPLRGEGDAP